ncbi:MAG: amidohydrolase family protein, partial [Candidatus Cloacimonas sp.]|nr:amidohydrolase family protein [Candidatus Cloacimonas sp.]
MSFDVVIEGGTIVTMDAAYQVLEDHCIGLKNGKIEAIFPRAATAYTTDKRIDGRDCLIIPGLINAHSHLAMTYFRGLADDLPLEKWLHEFIWPLEAKLLQPQFVYDASLHGAAEMIKNGISLTSDMYFHMSSIADACSQAGLRVIIGEALIDHQLSKTDGKTAIGDKIKQMKVAYQGNPLIDFSLAPHAIYTCSQETLQKCAEVAMEHGFLVHMHLSETKEEALNCLKEHGKLPVEYLQELGLLNTRIVLAHGIWMEDSELELLAASGKSSVAICTESNLKLTAGF